MLACTLGVCPWLCMWTMPSEKRVHAPCAQNQVGQVPVCAQVALIALYCLRHIIITTIPADTAEPHPGSKWSPAGAVTWSVASSARNGGFKGTLTVAYQGRGDRQTEHKKCMRYQVPQEPHDVYWKPPEPDNAVYALSSSAYAQDSKTVLCGLCYIDHSACVTYAHTHTHMSHTHIVNNGRMCF